VKRTLGSLSVIAILIGVVVIAEVRLGKITREDPLGRELLYLPSPEMLKIMSLGNPGLVADVLYLWSIQYYSFYQPRERFLYLETVYNLITDLDPLYVDAYRIGALIMQIQTGGDQEGLEGAVRRLFDKGLRNLPDDWQLAEAAAWDFFIRFKDREVALHYAEIATQRPGAPPRIKRMVGVWRDKENAWTLDDSVEYWRRALEDAENEWDHVLCMNQFYDAMTARDRKTLEPLLAFGDPYGIGLEDCGLVAFKKFKNQ